MDDELLARLLAADPVSDEDLESERTTERLAAISERIVEQTAPGQPVPDEPAGPPATVPSLDTVRTRRRRRLIAAGGGMAAAVVAVLVAVTMVLTTPQSAPSQAAQLLTAAADGAAQAPYENVDLAAGQNLYQKKSVTTPYGHDGIGYTVTETTVTTLGPSGNGTTQVTVGDPQFASPSDRQQWIDRGRPDLPGTGGGGMRPGIVVLELGGQTFPSIEADEHVLVGRDRLRSELEQQGDPFAAALKILLTPGVPNASRAELYRVMASLDGSTVAEQQPGGEQIGTEATITRDDGTLAVTFATGTGQVMTVDGLDDTTVTIESAGIYNCVEPEGPGGPSLLFVGCATGGYQLTGLHWNNWGAPTAYGEGTASVQQCDPDCARGTTHTYPVDVEMTDQRECGYNLPLYTRLVIRYPQDADVPGVDGAVDTYDLSCTPP